MLGGNQDGRRRRRRHLFKNINISLTLIALATTCLMIIQLEPTESSAEVNNNHWTSNDDSWSHWWHYSGVSGPSFWGLLNSDWYMCDKGRKQSPIDIETKALIYDPHLKPLLIQDNHLISGVLYNDGHSIVFNSSIAALMQMNRMQSQPNNRTKRSSASDPSIDDIFNFSDLAQSKTQLSVNLKDLSKSVELSIDPTNELQQQQQQQQVKEDNFQVFDLDPTTINNDEIQFSGAGLNYPYKFEAFYLKFDVNSASGSEHLINSHSYAAELQFMAYNSHLYKSYSEAQQKPNGLLGISVLINESPENTTADNKTMAAGSPLDNLLVDRLDWLRFRGDSTLVKGFNLSSLLADPEHFVGYDGSLTTPGCHESVSWLILNKPLAITQSNLRRLRSISADEQSAVSTGTLVAGNIRPVQAVNNRPIRTNIKPKTTNQNPETCQRLWTRFDYRETRSIGH